MDNYKNPKPGKTYISPALPPLIGTPGQKSGERVRIASRLIESDESYAFADIKSETILRVTRGGDKYISAKFLEIDRHVFVLSIQDYTVASNKPRSASFAFRNEEITTLCYFLQSIQTQVFKDHRSTDIKDEELKRITLSQRQALKLVEENQELFAEVIRASITKNDVVSVGYRKKQLDTFQRLLDEPVFFAETKARKEIKSNEALWQAFFEKNPCIFGYGLSYIYLDGLDNKKLEQVVQGHRVNSYGKRADALMKTRGVISCLCFVEVKTPETALLGPGAYRKGCWPASVELSGAISQTQGTVFGAMETLRGKLSMNDDNGDPTDEEMFNYAPKSFLVVGNFGQFVVDQGVNQDKLRSFELLRRNCHSPEIITFDELYERARFIVQHAAE